MINPLHDRDLIIEVAKAYRAAGILSIKTSELELTLAPEGPPDPAPRTNEDTDTERPPVASPHIMGALDTLLNGRKASHAQE